jgi:hypothetical protein
VGGRVAQSVVPPGDPRMQEALAAHGVTATVIPHEPRCALPCCLAGRPSGRGVKRQQLCPLVGHLVGLAELRHFGHGNCVSSLQMHGGWLHGLGWLVAYGSMMGDQDWRSSVELKDCGRGAVRQAGRARASFLHAEGAGRVR